ncbi:MAG: epoxyqueuosine reductase [Clostridia bacterium]|nr:epoxyqueuosine reductase [Clostridia bacterium]
MNEIISSFFEEKKIEYFSVLDYSDCREINHGIMARENFSPKSVITFLIPYYTAPVKNLSVYAASLDYHLIIREITGELIALLSEKYPRNSFRGYGDHSPIDERHAALIAGLGILGDSGLLINEKYGTFVFIADVVTDIPPDELGAAAPREVELCTHCGACRRACPTGILRSEGDDCLSAITQRKGELADFEVEMMRKCDTVWGCDVCQLACPYNREVQKTPLEFFHLDRIECLTTDILESFSKADFALRAFAWRGRKTVARNLEKLGY